MERDVLRHAFEPFFTTKEAGQGTGLGLATVYGVVTQSEGHVALESKPGEGSEVVIHLPLVGATEEATDEAQPAGEGLLTGQGETILVVEDESPVRAAAVRILREHGYRVVEAADGQHAIQIVDGSREDIDLLLTDIRMYPLSGIEVVKRARAIVPELSAVFMTGHSDRPTDDSVPTLMKPFDAKQLLAIVRESRTGNS